MENYVEVNGEFIGIPYNDKNVLITKDDLMNMMKPFNITFEVNHIDMLHEALTHRSYIDRDCFNTEKLKEYRRKMGDKVVELRKRCNERFEFYGDTVFKTDCAKYLMMRYPDEDEGFMTKLKTKIENKETLASFSRIVGLDKYLIISAQTESTSARTGDKLLEDVFEAFMGYLAFEAGYEVCENFVFQLLESEIDFASLLYKDNNYKDHLLRFYHKNKWSHPIYKEMKVEGPPHKRIFTIGVCDKDDKIIGVGKSKSKKQAEQLAARQVLLDYKLISEDQIPDE
jgi:dsRNA-specific ribonuclease